MAKYCRITTFLKKSPYFVNVYLYGINFTWYYFSQHVFDDASLLSIFIRPIIHTIECKLKSHCTFQKNFSRIKCVATMWLQLFILCAIRCIRIFCWQGCNSRHKSCYVAPILYLIEYLLLGNVKLETLSLKAASFLFFVKSTLESISISPFDNVMNSRYA